MTTEKEPKANKVIELSEGKKATILPFKGKHVIYAQKVTGDDTEKLIYAIIAQCVLIDGQNVLMEDLDEMPGADLLKLIGEFGENFQ